MNLRKTLITDATGIAKVSVDTWRTTYRGIVPDKILDELSYEQKDKTWHRTLSLDKNIVFVVENEGGSCWLRMWRSGTN